MTMMNAINWPEGYLPGTTDNFASNEAIVKGISAADVWPFLVKAALWPSYYSNSSDVSLREGEDGIDVVHAWLIEDLEGGRVRILTQESQRGGGARKLHNTHPNPMINGHQDWIDGLVKAAASARSAR